MATTTVSAYYADATHWTDHRPDYAQINDALGPAAANVLNSRDCASSVCGLATSSPSVLAIVLQGDEDHVYVVHSPTVYHGDPINATAFDNLVVVMAGNDVGTAVPMVLPQAAFQLTGNTRCLNLAEITGVNGHGANPAVQRSGPHGGGVANTNEIRYRRAFLMPAQDSEHALTASPDGRYTLIGFHNTFIAPKTADADVNVQAIGTMLATWFRLASTNVNGGSTAVAVQPVTSVNPIHNLRLNAHTQRIKDTIMNRMGVGGPQLTTVAFNAGIAGLNNQIQAATDQRIAYDRDTKNKTFTDKHGDALAAQVHRLCNVADDAGLPTIHGILAKAPKSKEYSILESEIGQRLITSDIGMAAAAAPIPTPKMLDEVFRRYRPGAMGHTFGQGLTPFCIVCESHPEMLEQKNLIAKAAMAEAGASLSLEDAQAIISSDVRMPTTAYIAQEKLQGWSIIVDIFHGVNHPLAASIRAMVQLVGPNLHRVASMAADDEYGGMDHVWRILFEVQQEYFAYVNARCNNVPAAIPDFREVITAVNTFRVQKLSKLPEPWYALVKKKEQPAFTPVGDSASRSRTSGGKRTNARANRALMKRFSESGHATISAMVQGHDVEYPKHRDKPVCLSWALKGECNDNCKRSGNHVHYPTEVNKKIHELMDKCGVSPLES